MQINQLLRSAMAGRSYKLQSKHSSNIGFDQTLKPCSGYILFAAEQRVGYQPTARSKLSVKSVGIPIARGKLVGEFNFHKEGVNLPCRLYKRNKY